MKMAKLAICAWAGNKSSILHEYAARRNKVLGGIFMNSRKRGMTIGYGHDCADNVVEHCMFWGNREAARLTRTLPELETAGEGGQAIGCEIEYRYENGELTQQPLWPWPMQGRIEKELGIDVMSELRKRFGPIEE